MLALKQEDSMQTSVDLWLYIAVPSSSVSMWCWGYVCL